MWVALLQFLQSYMSLNVFGFPFFHTLNGNLGLAGIKKANIYVLVSKQN
jgi:hypothetical protein